jgi:hypothetical protein
MLLGVSLTGIVFKNSKAKSKKISWGLKTFTPLYGKDGSILILSMLSNICSVFENQR